MPVAFLLDETTFSQLKGGQAQELLASNRAGGRGAIFVWEDWIGELEDFEVAILREAFPEDLFLLWPRAFERLTARSQKKFLYRFAAQDQAVCKRRSISGGQWTKIDKTLPGVRAMAGTFLPDSGGNCFATAMTAFEPELVAELWVQRDAFETWLEERRPVAGAQIELGTLLVWRSDATVAGGNRANPQPLPR
ncbi:MAG TPA: hypothetical protein VF168_00460 [Trueperaceae bacterium]